MSLLLSIAFGPIEGVCLLDVDRLVDRARVVGDGRGLGRDRQVVRFVGARQVQVDVGHTRVFETVGGDHQGQAASAKRRHGVHRRHVEVNLEKKIHFND